MEYKYIYNVWNPNKAPIIYVWNCSHVNKMKVCSPNSTFHTRDQQTQQGSKRLCNKTVTIIKKIHIYIFITIIIIIYRKLYFLRALIIFG